jgi:hypothetical protein
MKKKYSIDVVDIEWFEGKPHYTVCVYRWILFGLFPICAKSYFGEDLDALLFEAKDYVDKNGEYKNKK